MGSLKISHFEICTSNMSNLGRGTDFLAREGPSRRWWLNHRWWMPAVVLLGMLITLPAIDAGLSLDDFLHWRTLNEGPRAGTHPGSPWGLFHFATGDLARNHALKTSGELMWWAADDLRVTFWRPLAEVSHWLDHRLWPHSPESMHLHSMLWWGALIWLAARLYRSMNSGLPDARLLASNSPPWVPLAALFFVVSNLHLTAVLWIAARNQLMAACFMVACISAFHAWRMARSPRQGVIAAGLFLLSLLSAEAGMATLGYLAAHVLVIDGPDKAAVTWRQRARDLLPFLLIAGVWRALYTTMGYGSSGSGFYIDPGADPLRFAGALVMRLPVLLGTQFFGVSSGTLNLLAPPHQAMYAALAACAVLLSWRVAGALGLWRLPVARFLGLGALLALVPMCAAEPTDRLLLASEIGFCGLLGMALPLAWAQRSAHHGWRALTGKAVIWPMMVVHLVVFPVQAVLGTTFRKTMSVPWAVTEPLSLSDAARDPQARTVLLNPPFAALASYYPSARRYLGLTNPASTHALANGSNGLALTVIDRHTLELRDPSGKGFVDNFTRDVVTRPFKLGEPLDAGAIQATVTSLSPSGMPLAVRFRFDTPLYERPWRFHVWTENGYVPFAMPAIGERVSLPALDLARLMMRLMREGWQRAIARPAQP
jgi:hypothetical protein